MERIGIAFSDQPNIRDYVRLGRLAEDLGYTSIWVTEPRLARDAVSGMAVLASSTERLQIGPAVVNTWTRGPGLMAQTWATLNELAPGRIAMGIGAYWDPLASNQGIRMHKQLTAMREYVDVLRRLFRREIVTFDGEVIHVKDLCLDAARADDLAYGREHYADTSQIPVYLGPSGPKMLELTGEIADGCLLNAPFSAAYVRDAITHIAKGAARAGRQLSDLDLPKMIYVSIDHGGEDAWGAVKRKVTRYLGAQPHVMKASGLDEDQLGTINDAMGGWPPKPGGLQAAAELVPDEVVASLCVFGSVEECRVQIQGFLDAGASYPILITEGDVEEVIHAFAPATWTTNGH